MSDNAETVVLSGGSYWIMQQLLRHRDGVVSTRVGWTGGENDDPTEERPDLGEDLVGSSYRSEIFYSTDEQRKVAEETIPDVDASGHWPGKVVTEISEAGRFWEAEAEEQDCFHRYPVGCASPFPRTGVEAAGS